MKQKEAPGDLDIQVNNKKMMKRFFFLLMISILVIVSCTPTKKIQTAIIKKDIRDTVAAPAVNHAHEDSMLFIQNTYKTVLSHHIDFKTFSAKIDADYIDADDKKYNVNVF